MSEVRALSKDLKISKGKPPAVIPYDGADSINYLTPEYLRQAVQPSPAKPNYNSVLVKDGDTIILWDGSNAGEVFRGKRGLLASTMVVVSPPSDFTSAYFFYALKNHESTLKARTNGTGIPHVDKEVLIRIQLLCPDEAQQRRIASILETADSAIELTESLISKYQSIKQGMMHDLFTRGVDENGVLRPPYEEAPELYKKTELGWVPKEWDVSSAFKLCNAVIDCKNRTPPETDTGYPVVKTSNIRDGRMVTENITFTDEKSFETWTQRGKPRAGDILITREAPVGEVCMIPPEYPVCLGQRIMMYQPDPEKLDNSFLLYALLSQRVQKRLIELAGGSTVGHVRVDDIRTLWIPNCCIEEQRRVATVLDGIHNRLDAETRTLSKLRSLKLGLMHDLLSGKVRVPLTQSNQKAA